MVKMGAARVSEPAAGAACPPLPGGSSSTPALLESMWRWHHPDEGDNQRLALQTSEEDAERLAAVLSEHESEVARVEAAHALAAAVIAGSESALGALLRAFRSSREAVARAAMSGLTCCQTAAVEPMIALLREWLDQRRWDRAEEAVHILGQCADGASEDAVAVLGAALGAALADLEAHDSEQRSDAQPMQVRRGVPFPIEADGNDPRATQEGPVDLYALPRRRTAAECCCALGLVGHRAQRRGAAAVALAALELLIPRAVEGEPGARHISTMWPAMVRTTAAAAILRISSDPSVGSAAVMPLLGRAEQVGPHTSVAGLIGEAVRRAEASAPACATLSAVLARLKREGWPWNTAAPLYEPFVAG